MKSKLLLIVPLVLVLSFSLILPVRAAIWQGGEALVLSNPLDDDLYAAGQSITLARPVTGDAYMAGGQISVSEPVSQDVVAAGGTITLSQSVGDDARLAGGTILVTGAITDDLVVTGGTITIDRQAVIGGDLVVTGGTVAVHGTVKGMTKIYGGQVLFSGTAEGPADIRAEEVTLAGTFKAPSVFTAGKKLQVSDPASFLASIQYYQPTGVYNFGAHLQNGATADYRSDLGSINHRNDERLREASRGFYGFWQIATFFSALLIMFLMILLAPKLLRSAGERLQKNFWSSFGMGVVYFIVTPIVAFVCMITIIGIPIGLILLTLYGITFLFIKAYTAILMASWAETRFKATWSKWKLWLVSVAAYLLLRLLMFVPIIGWLAVMLLVVSATGAMLKTKWNYYRSKV